MTEIHGRAVTPWDSGSSVKNRWHRVEDGQGRSMMKLFQELRQEMGSSVDQTGSLGKRG